MTYVLGLHLQLLQEPEAYWDIAGLVLGIESFKTSHDFSLFCNHNSIYLILSYLKTILFTRDVGLVRRNLKIAYKALLADIRTVEGLNSMDYFLVCYIIYVKQTSNFLNR